MSQTNIDLIFEVSWEVCNKVGGIYTVLASKSKILQKNYHDKIIFIGPWFGNKHNNDLFEEDHKLIPAAHTVKLPYNIKIHTGRWKIPGRPIVVLIEYKGIYPHLNEIYGQMWEKFGVDSLHSYGDYDESCAFALASAFFIGEYSDKVADKSLNVIAHFNEWTTGMGLLLIKSRYPSIATVFTTHATSIGRSICGNNKPLYGFLNQYNGDGMAQELNMQSKHSLEKAAAHAAHCFTAVSEVTARECEQLLEKRPHIVTPNGFEKAIAGTKTEQLRLREQSRKKIFEIASALTDKEYDDSTYVIATSGRNEYRNKGIDVFLDAIASLKDSSYKYLALILVPAWVKEPRHDLSLKINDHNHTTFSEKNLTHWLYNDYSDAIFNRIKGLNLDNNNDSNVDIIYMPCYLNGNDGILNMDYYSALPGIDLTVFPSYYEPWGYTPLESIAFGVPTVTTTLSGFGQWIADEFPMKGFEDTAVGVVERDDFNYHDTVKAIASIINGFAGMTAKQRVTINRNARHTSESALWDKFIEHYEKAYQIAIMNRNK